MQNRDFFKKKKWDWEGQLINNETSIKKKRDAQYSLSELMQQVIFKVTWTWSSQPVVHVSRTSGMQVTLILHTSVGQVLPRSAHKRTYVCLSGTDPGTTQPPQAISSIPVSETLTKQLIKHIAVFNTGVVFGCYNCHT